MPSFIDMARIVRIVLWCGIFMLLTSCAHRPLPGPHTGDAGSNVTPSGTPAHAQPTPEPEPAVAPVPVPVPQEAPPAPGVLWEWEGYGRRVSHIWVDVDTQKARFYDGSNQIGWTFVASGLKKYPTPTGNFIVMEKLDKKRSNLYGKIYNRSGRVVKSDAKHGRDRIPAGGRFAGAKMPYFMRLTYDGIGMHAGSIPKPGSPASHGCIRMPKEVAPLLFRHVDIGTAVSITGQGPDYGNYAERQGLAGP